MNGRQKNEGFGETRSFFSVLCWGGGVHTPTKPHLFGTLFWFWFCYSHPFIVALFSLVFLSVLMFVVLGGGGGRLQTNKTKTGFYTKSSFPFCENAG